MATEDLNIAVFGATGMVGSAIVTEAAERGLHVIGVTRSGAPENPVDGVEYRTGNLTDTTAVTALAEEVDVLVIATTGNRETGDYSEVLDGHADLVDAAPKTRLFVVGGAGGLETEDGRTLVDAGLIPKEYAAEPATFIKVLDMYRGSAESLDWVMLAPSPSIEPGEKTASYTLSDARPAGEHVTTGTFAAAALDEIEKPAHRRARFTVADA